jgi:spore germination protein YaaH
MARKKVIDLDTYNARDAYSSALHEYYKSLRKAGFSIEIALALMSDRDTYPDWILPTLPNKIQPLPYDDDED